MKHDAVVGHIVGVETQGTGGDKNPGNRSSINCPRLKKGQKTVPHNRGDSLRLSIKLSHCPISPSLNRLTHPNERVERDGNVALLHHVASRKEVRLTR